MIYLGHDDVHLPAELPQCVHQLFGIFVDSDPAAVHKDLSGTKTVKPNKECAYWESLSTVS